MGRDTPSFGLLGLLCSGFRQASLHGGNLLSRRRLIVAVAAALIFAGLCLIASGGYLHAKGWLSQVLLERAWDQRLDGHSLGYAKPWPWADMAPLVRILVPRLGVNRIVLSNSSGRTLAFGPAHLSGTGLPGEVGHSVVTGHRDTHFRFLKELDLDDVIRVQKSDGTYVEFVVIGTNVFDARAAHFAEAEARKILTLVTCYPFDAVQNGSPLRYAVFAEAF